jgi:hypothetical protein
LRKDICDRVRLGTIGRDVLTFKLDELHALSLKPRAVAIIEPNSATEIGNMKKWAMSTLARPGPMALVEDGVLFSFIAMKLMAQDKSLAESVVDEEFATFLARSNTVQKSLTAAVALAKGKSRGSDVVQPPHRASTCPKCHFGHVLRECTAEYATLSRNGPVTKKV